MNCFFRTRCMVGPAMLLSAISWLVPAGCRREVSDANGAGSTVDEAPFTADGVAARMEVWPREVRVQGSLLSDKRAVVGAKVAGRIRRIDVDLGSTVKKGDLLAGLDQEDLDLRVREAEAQLQQVRAKLGLRPADDEAKLVAAQVPSVVEAEAIRNQARDGLTRAKSLVKQLAMQVEELQQRQAAMEVAEARHGAALHEVQQQVAEIGVKWAALALAKQTRLDAEVRAPFDGIVEQRHVVPGVYVQAGDPVVTLVSSHPLRFQVGVPERDAPLVRAGQSVRIQVDGRTLHEKPNITRLSPAVDRSNRSLLVEAEVDNRAGELRTGSFVEGWIEVEPTATTLCVPASAVLEFAGVEKVWLERNGKAEQRIVQTGRRDAQRIEIVGGLREGDRMIRVASDGRFGPVVLKPVVLKPASDRAAAVAPAARTSK